jgi:hypothetical protein
VGLRESIRRERQYQKIIPSVVDSSKPEISLGESLLAEAGPNAPRRTVGPVITMPILCEPHHMYAGSYCRRKTRPEFICVKNSVCNDRLSSPRGKQGGIASGNVEPQTLCSRSSQFQYQVSLVL